MVALKKLNASKKISEIVDIDKPNLFREFFPYTTLPKIRFNEHTVQMNLPREIWVTDTTFRDGQQAREPYSVEQIVLLYDLMHRFGGKKGYIRTTEFYLYTKRDREAIRKCLQKGYEYPKITSWIRAKEEDLELVKTVNVEETGILSSLSDYHIFYKFGWSRRKTIQNHLNIAEACLKREIIPRCHIEDATRADLYGVVIPFIQRLIKLSEEYGLPTKVRVCDTLGVGLPFPNAMPPRSIPRLMHAIVKEGGLPSEWLEFHGHNDFHLAIANSTAAWLYGCCGNNGTFLGIGERAGNTPIEGLLFQLMQLVDDTGIDTTIVNEIAEFYSSIGYDMPEFYPLLGRNFDVTRAGVHADGMVKNPEIYTSFDYSKVLGRKLRSAVGSYSGASGIAWRVSDLLHLKREEWLTKDDPGILRIKEEVDRQFAEGRIADFSDIELAGLIKQFLPEYLEEANRLSGDTPFDNNPLNSSEGEYHGEKFIGEDNCQASCKRKG
ncbi:MAG: 2-isopropylmalate synthase [Candidatus Bathycorpusculaceae bacterium]